MKWEALEASIPYLVGPTPHIEPRNVLDGAGWSVAIRQPGVHQYDTDPQGGDFVVEVTSASAMWNDHRFTHVDLFEDFESKCGAAREWVKADLLCALLKVVLRGESPVDVPLRDPPVASLPGLEARALLTASQSLALCEWRRYKSMTAYGGGKILPLKFVAGIVHERWTANQAAVMVGDGLKGLKRLEKLFGSPPDPGTLLGRCPDD